jgi:hypothetical protein
MFLDDMMMLINQIFLPLATTFIVLFFAVLPIMDSVDHTKIIAAAR